MPDTNAIRRLEGTTYRAEPTPDRIIRFIASTGAVARDGGIVDVGGWEFDDLLRAHPSFLWSHNPEVPPLGQIIAMERTADALLADVQFAPEGFNAFADMVYKYYLAGILRAVSIGFRVLEERQPTPDEMKMGARWCCSSATALELSAVACPSDVGAVAIGTRGGLFTRSDLALSRRQFGSIQGWEPIHDAIEAAIDPTPDTPAVVPSCDVVRADAPIDTSTDSTSPEVETETQVEWDHEHDICVEMLSLMERLQACLLELHGIDSPDALNAKTISKSAPPQEDAAARVESVTETSSADSNAQLERLLRTFEKAAEDVGSTQHAREQRDSN